MPQVTEEIGRVVLISFILGSNDEKATEVTLNHLAKALTLLNKPEYSVEELESNTHYKYTHKVSTGAIGVSEGIENVLQQFEASTSNLQDIILLKQLIDGYAN